MDGHFAATKLTNTTLLCVGGITRKEAEAARSDGLDISGQGYYLFLANEEAPDEPVRLLGQIFSADHADRLSRMLSRLGG